ncbi:MAG: type VI secretion system baseplate subunit TssK [Planctomycetota bacterium]
MQNLARIDWKMGQTLLPAHFFAQEEALVADTVARFGFIGVPFTGIGRLRWNDSLLSDGILSIMNLSAVLPIGAVVMVPGNTVSRSFNLNTVGTTRVTVYAHLTNERGQVPVAQADQEAADGEPLERVIHTIALGSDQTHPDAVYTFKLADFEKNIEGKWGLVDDFIPPLLQVGTSPFLVRFFDHLSKAITLFQQRLREDIAASYLGGEGLMSAKTCLKAVYKMERFLANAHAQIKFHPYDLYEALKTFYAEVCVYQDANPEDIASPYLHDDLAGCLKKIARPLFERLNVSKGKTPYLSFDRKDGVFQLTPIPDEVRVAKEVFLLLQKPKVGEVVSFDGVKLASRTRLPVVHQLSLLGIPAKKIERPPFQHQFGAEVEFYQLSKGDEWDQALRETNLAFFDSPAVAKVKAYLYWRSV